MAGELALAGLRELEEEIDLSIGAGELAYLGAYRSVRRIPASLDRES
jgi:hypothetical protein